MNIYKRIILGGLFIVGIVFFSCKKDFLKINPPNSLTEVSFFRNSGDAQSAIIAVYNSVRNFNSNDYAKLTEGPLPDVMIYNATGINLDGWSINADDAILDGVWQIAYQGIFRANLVLQNVPGIDMDEDEKGQIIGEANFLRALFYWQLTTMFGEVPLVLKAEPTDIASAILPKSKIQDIYDQMIKDLKVACVLLPNASTVNPSRFGRATKGSAQALLGKVYLYDKDFENSEKYLDSVISSGEYKLIPNFSDLLIVDNNEESLFEIQYDDQPGQGSTRIGYDYPQGQGGFANLLPTQDLVDAYESYAGPKSINGRDPRLFYTIFREGDPYDNISPVFKSSWTPTGYARKKGSYPVIRTNNENLGRNFPIIRFGDVLLMFAEAANENGKKERAISAINQVRNRVGMPDLPTIDFPTDTKNEIFNAIVHERRVELALEHHYLNDLQRWDLAKTVLTSQGYEFPKHRYYPLPQQELNNNPLLEQNPEYRK